ncbi:MAG: TetR/AcrR family transcriptional regulator [Alphaproteobacteria bacterium]|jgi:AcrR family transcriptional regulator|nr:TetR/AcrR family transcriptional regulator [Alphaproteobacteria bacterium]
MASAKREHLVDTALDLFYQGGFHATGVDEIIEKAGVARMTLYNHFKSKDELILATLRKRDKKFRNWFMRTVERLGKAPEGRLLAIFDTLEEWFTGKEYSGCMFINASAEFANPKDPIKMAASEHKNLVLKYVSELAMAAGALRPGELADGIMLLMEGAIVMSYVTGDKKAAARGKKAAKILIQQSRL